MALFLIVALEESVPHVDAGISRAFATSSYRIEPGKWFVHSTLQTSKEVSDAIGITADPPAVTNLRGVVVAVKGYYGRGPSDLWEWVAKQQL